MRQRRDPIHSQQVVSPLEIATALYDVVREQDGSPQEDALIQGMEDRLFELGDGRNLTVTTNVASHRIALQNRATVTELVYGDIRFDQYEYHIGEGPTRISKSMNTRKGSLLLHLLENPGVEYDIRQLCEVEGVDPESQTGRGGIHQAMSTILAEVSLGSTHFEIEHEKRPGPNRGMERSYFKLVHLDQD